MIYRICYSKNIKAINNYYMTKVNSMRKIIASFAALLVVAGMVSFTIPASTLAVVHGQGSDNLTRVLIAFDKPVGPSEQALVRAHGGKIKYSYSIVDAVGTHQCNTARRSNCRVIPQSACRIH
jgi:hypothetical protein